MWVDDNIWETFMVKFMYLIELNSTNTIKISNRVTNLFEPVNPSLMVNLPLIKMIETGIYSTYLQK